MYFRVGKKALFSSANSSRSGLACFTVRMGEKGPKRTPLVGGFQLFFGDYSSIWPRPKSTSFLHELGVFLLRAKTPCFPLRMAELEPKRPRKGSHPRLFHAYSSVFSLVQKPLLLSTILGHSKNTKSAAFQPGMRPKRHKKTLSGPFFHLKQAFKTPCGNCDPRFVRV